MVAIVRPHGLQLLVLATLLQCTIANFYESCFRYVKYADKNGDYRLTPEEYMIFLDAYSRGSVKNTVGSRLPDILVKPFRKNSSVALKQVVLDGVRWDAPKDKTRAAKQFCHDTNQGLMRFFKVQVELNGCVDALKTGDTTAPLGKLSRDPEYIPFLEFLLDKSFTSFVGFDGLPDVLKTAFDDMAIDNFIVGANGADYLMEFCLRSKLASLMNDDSPENYVDPFVENAIPQQTPTGQATNEGGVAPSSTQPSEVQAVGNGVSSDDKESAHEITAETQATGQAPDAAAKVSSSEVFVLSDDDFRKCRNSMMIADSDRNGRMEEQEFMRFLNRLNNNLPGVLYDDGHNTFKQSYETMKEHFGGPPQLQGAQPGVVPTGEILENLQFICQETFSTIAQARKAAGLNADSSNAAAAVSAQGSTNELSLFDEFLVTCKTAMFVSDRNRDSKLDQEEYVKLIVRLARNTKLRRQPFADFDPVFTDVYAQLGNSIDITGTRPGSQPNDTNDEHLRFVCQNIESALVAYNQG